MRSILAMIRIMIAMGCVGWLMVVMVLWYEWRRLRDEWERLNSLLLDPWPPPSPPSTCVADTGWPNAVGTTGWLALIKTLRTPVLQQLVLFRRKSTSSLWNRPIVSFIPKSLLYQCPTLESQNEAHWERIRKADSSSVRNTECDNTVRPNLPPI